MNSDDQSSFKLKAILSKDYVFPIGSVILIAIAFLNKDIPQFNSGAFLGLGCAGLGVLSQLLRIQLRAFEVCVVVTIVMLFGVAFIARGNNPQLSSISFMSAVSLLLGGMAILSLARFQIFFYKKWQQGTSPYAGNDYPDNSGGFVGSDHSANHISWSGYDSWGDCGGDGGGGDCGG